MGVQEGAEASQTTSLDPFLLYQALGLSEAAAGDLVLERSRPNARAVLAMADRIRSEWGEGTHPCPEFPAKDRWDAPEAHL
jgi:hypothetical protein